MHHSIALILQNLDMGTALCVPEISLGSMSSLLERLKLYSCFMYLERLLHSNRVQTGAPRIISCLTHLVPAV